MDLLQCVKEYMSGNNPAGPFIMADWLYEYKSDHPEFAVYHKRLKSGKVRTRTMLDVCIKFGNRQVRREAAKIGRWVLKSRELSRYAKLKLMRKNEKLNPQVLAVMAGVEARFAKRRRNRNASPNA